MTAAKLADAAGRHAPIHRTRHLPATMILIALAVLTLALPAAAAAQADVQAVGRHPVHEQTRPAPLGEVVDRFAGSRLRPPVLIEIEAREPVQDATVPPDYRLMAVAGIATAAAGLFLSWLLLNEEALSVYDWSNPFYGTMPGTVFIPLVVHTVNGGRGNVLAGIGASAVIWAGTIYGLRVSNPLLTPALQIPVAVVIESGTMDRDASR